MRERMGSFRRLIFLLFSWAAALFLSFVSVGRGGGGHDFFVGSLRRVRVGNFFFWSASLRLRAYGSRLRSRAPRRLWRLAPGKTAGARGRPARRLLRRLCRCSCAPRAVVAAAGSLTRTLPVGSAAARCRRLPGAPRGRAPRAREFDARRGGGNSAQLRAPPPTRGSGNVTRPPPPPGRACVLPSPAHALQGRPATQPRRAASRPVSARFWTMAKYHPSGASTHFWRGWSQQHAGIATSAGSAQLRRCRPGRRGPMCSASWACAAHPTRRGTSCAGRARISLR